MKKLLVIALAVILVVSAVCVLAACGKEEVVEGEYSYFAYDYAAQALSTTNKYGCKVTVTVKGGVITNVEIDDDTETYYNLSASWGDKAKWTEGCQAFLDSFKGLSVEEVNKIGVETVKTLTGTTPAGQPDTGSSDAPKNPLSNVPANLKPVAGATQSTGRVILAVQNALTKLSTAK